VGSVNPNPRQPKSFLLSFFFFFWGGGGFPYDDFFYDDCDMTTDVLDDFLMMEDAEGHSDHF